MVSVRKSGKVYKYRIEIASINGVRKRLTKSGFKTRQEALHEGAIAYNEYYQYGKKQKDMSYADYLGYWIDNYCNFNLKYSTIVTYLNIIKLYLKQDSVFRIFSKKMYKQEIILCENLLYRVRDSYNNLDELEKFIIKNFEFMNQSKYTDKILMDELLLYKYYDLKKSAYIKMGLQLNLDNEKRTDDELREYFINYLSKYALVTFEN